MEKQFEQASRFDLRFPSTKGLLEVKDLWNLPRIHNNTAVVTLTVLIKNAYSVLQSKTKLSDELAFLNENNKKQELDLDQLRFDILKYIYEVRVNEENATKDAKELKEELEKRLDAKYQKQEELMKNKSVEELDKEIAELQEKLKNLNK